VCEGVLVEEQRKGEISKLPLQDPSSASNTYAYSKTLVRFFMYQAGQTGAKEKRVLKSIDFTTTTTLKVIPISTPPL